MLIMADVRPIDANALMGRIIQRSQVFIRLITPNGKIGYSGLLVEDIQQIVDEAPTINPDDLRPQGRWEEIRNDYGELEGWLHVDCGRESKSKDKYCGTCGAKMDGKENEDA